MKKLLLLLMAIPLAFSSCGKKGDPEPKTPTVRELLTSGKWYLEKMDPGTVLPSCTKKTYLSFSDDGIMMLVSYNEETSGCVLSSKFIDAYNLVDDKYIKPESGNQIEIVKLTDMEFVYRTPSGDGYITFAFDKTEG